MPTEFYRPSAPFAVARVELPRNILRTHPNRFSWDHGYNVVKSKPLDQALVARAVLLAKRETARYCSEDDLDRIAFTDESGFDPVRHQLAHALEHIAVSEIARNSVHSTLWLLHAALTVGGIPAETRSFSHMGSTFSFVSFQQGFAETPQDEIRGVIRACERVLEA